MINTKLGPNSTLSAIRRQTGAGSLCAFMKMYLHHRVPLPWSRMHKEISIDYDQIGSTEPLHLVLAAPDGYGKTTMTTYGLVLWALAYKKCRCIVIGSHTRTAAGELLRGVDHELRTNKTLHTDFPHLVSIQRGSGASGSRASPPRNILVQDVARVTTSGPQLRLEEIDFEGSPPDLIILDGFEANPEDNDWSKPKSKSKKLEKQMKRIRSKLPDTSLIMIDSLLYGTCLIDRLLVSGVSDRGWTRRFYSAVKKYPVEFDLWFKWADLWYEDPTQAQSFLNKHGDQLVEGTKVLWPEHESMEQLMILRARKGWEWFDRHRQGCPLEGSIRALNYDHYFGKPKLWDGPNCVIDSAGYHRVLDHEGVTLTMEDDCSPEGRPLPERSEGSGF